MIKIGALTIGCLLALASAAQAATLVSFEGNSTDGLATGTASLSLSGNTLTGSLTNTSPYDARIMSFGFDIAAGNANGFTGSANMGFTFSDDDFGNVAQFNTAVIDFGASVNCTGTTTDNNCSFNGRGSPNNGLAPTYTVNFTATGPFGSLTEEEIAAALFVRFQRVGEFGQDSDVAVTDTAPVPEPASMMLLGTGLLYVVRRRMRPHTA
ncbi:MAG TPA: PEP-CTERM sorting domain-containing protein [Vicinamibacterales bacterium]|nr:PEP-CTERM sorting domain-containing protein [Vicinamibacterales bacterium]